MPSKAIVTITNPTCGSVNNDQLREALIDGDMTALRALTGIREGRDMPTAQDRIDIKDCTLRYMTFDSTIPVLLAACDGLTEAATAIELAATTLDVTATRAELNTRGANPIAHGSAAPLDIRIECIE